MKQFWKPSYHIFIRTPLPRYRWHHNLRSAQKLFFQTCLNCIYNIRLLSVYWPMFNTTLWLQTARKTRYHVRYKMLWRYNWYVEEFLFFETQSYYISLARSFNANHFLRKDHYLKIPQKRNIWHFLNFVIRKNLKEPLHCIYNFIIIHRSLLRPIKTKPVSF